MNGYCLSDKYCRYKSNTGYCGYTGGCVQDNIVTVKAPNTPNWSITKVVDISTDSIEAIAEAVAKKLRGEIGGIVRCKDCKHYKESATGDRKVCFREDVDGFPVCYEFEPDDFCPYGEEDER